MANLKLIAKLPRVFKQLKGLSAVVFNENGEELDSHDVTKRKLSFKLDKEDSLLGQDKANLTIKIIDENGEEVNFNKVGKQFDLDADEQEFTARVSNRKRRTKKRIRLSGTEVIQPDTTAPVFEDGSPNALDENSGADVVVFRAKANDDSGDAVTYSLEGADAGAFSINPQTGVITINNNADFEAKNKYLFDVIATDSSQNSSTKSLQLDINDLRDTGETITLTNFQDVYDANTGTTVNANGVQTPRNERLTAFDDVINASASTLGVGNQLDSLRDPSTGDNDTLNLTTNTANDLQTALAAGNLNNLTNIENLVVEARNDNSNDVDFSQVTELQKLDVNGFFLQDVQLTNYIDNAQINHFDFSGSTNTAIGFVVENANNNVNFTTEDLTFFGSPGADRLEASIGATSMHGGAGDDDLTGSSSNSSYIAGERGVDTINLVANNAATDIVSYEDIKSDANANNVTNFVAFLDAANNPTQNSHDKLEFDADTVTNFQAGTTVQQKTFAQLQAILGTGAANNHMLVDADPDTRDLSVHGESWVALDNVTGDLFFSQDGNFAANAEQIGNINFVNNDPTEFLSNRNVNVVA